MTKVETPSGSLTEIENTPIHPLALTPEVQEFQKRLKEFYFNQIQALRPSKHRKGRAVSKEVMKKRITAKKAKRKQSNKSRKINQRWMQK